MLQVLGHGPLLSFMLEWADAGLKQFDELPLSSTKGRTTSKKPRERSAFYDVTNADQSLSGEDSTSSVKNLSADFTPVKVLLICIDPQAPLA